MTRKNEIQESMISLSFILSRKKLYFYFFTKTIYPVIQVNRIMNVGCSTINRRPSVKYTEISTTIIIDKTNNHMVLNERIMTVGPTIGFARIVSRDVLQLRVKTKRSSLHGRIVFDFLIMRKVMISEF